MLARMHLAAPTSRPPAEPARPRRGGRDGAGGRAYLDADQAALIRDELAFQQQVAASPAYARAAARPDPRRPLPRQRHVRRRPLTGLFDFYFAGVDTWLFDIGVCLNDWCIDLESGACIEDRAGAFVAAYDSVRHLETQRAAPDAGADACRRVALLDVAAVGPAPAAQRGAADAARPRPFRARPAPAALSPGTTIAERHPRSPAACHELLLVPPRQGALWVRQGFRVFVKQPMAFAGLFATFLFAVFAPHLLPVVGPLLLLALLPLGFARLHGGTKRALDGRFRCRAPSSSRCGPGAPSCSALVKLGVV